MRLAVLKGGASRVMANGHVRKASGQHSVARAWVRTSAGLEQFYASLDSTGGGTSGASAGISVSPNSAGGAITRGTSGAITSSEVTVTATGGVAPYAYNWVQDTGPTVTPTAPGSATTAFQKLSVPPETEIDATFHCVVTDAARTPANSPTVSVTLINNGSTL